MLQTIMVLIEKHNSTLDPNNFPSTFHEGEELERCYGAFGCFSKAYPWTENRPDNNFPEPPDKIRVRYPVFTRRNRHVPVVLQADDFERIIKANIDPNGPFYMISHGFLESGDKPWIENMANNLLNLEGNEHASVFSVDWRGGSQPPYTQAVANIRLVGVMTAHFVKSLCDIFGIKNLDNFHFIGHSLGAHLGGYFGHTMQTKFNMKLGRITGLDPAGPFFSKTVTLVRLDRSDAKYVDIIHSNALPLYAGGLGMWEPIGHVDFYPNGGALQPGCKQGSNAPMTVKNDLHQWLEKNLGCNHQRSYELFVESIAPTCPFWGIQCDSYESFIAGNCTRCDNKHHCIPMGYHSHHIYKHLLKRGIVDTNNNVALYALTGGAKPYCRVHYEVTLKISNSTESRVHGPEIGKIAITLVDRNGNKTDQIYLNEEQKVYKPGDKEIKMIALRSTGHPPISAIVEWKYETNLFNPITWRLVKSPSVYIENLKISSLEYNTDITVCPKQNKPVITDMPNLMQTKFCKIN